MLFFLMFGNPAGFLSLLSTLADFSPPERSAST
jgi:hypothetical protein